MKCSGYDSIFTPLHFLCNLQMGPISFSVCPWQAFPTFCNVAVWLLGPIHKLWRKWSVVNMTPYSQHFIFFVMGQVSLIVCPWQAFPIYCNVALWHLGPIRKLWRKWSPVNIAPGAVFTVLYFLNGLWSVVNMTPYSKHLIFFEAYEWAK